MKEEETVLVTGASSGIGAGLARRFAESGSRLVLVARRESRLRQLAAQLGGPSETIPCDLAETGAAARLVDALRERGITIDVLVNNAGVGVHGGFVYADPQAQLGMIRLNVEALTELARLLLPPMVARGRGGVLNVASTAAFQPGPEMSVYYATKAYVLFFSEGVHEELRGTGVTVTCLCPGPTATEFAGAAGMTGTRLFRWFAKPVDHVAHAGYEGFRRSKPIVVPGLLNKLGVFSVRMSPRSLSRKLVRWLQ